MNVRNYIHLTGNLGANPKTFVLPSGDLSCTFSLATNDYYRDKDGNRVVTTEWHRIKAYGKLAELFAEHLTKGSQISVVGAMRYRSWTDKFEQKRLTGEVIATEFTFLGSKPQPSLDADAEGLHFEPDVEEMIAPAPVPTAAATQGRDKRKTSTRRTKKAPAVAA